MQALQQLPAAVGDSPSDAAATTSQQQTNDTPLRRADQVVGPSTVAVGAATAIVGACFYTTDVSLSQATELGSPDGQVALTAKVGGYLGMEERHSQKYEDACAELQQKNAAVRELWFVGVSFANFDRSLIFLGQVDGGTNQLHFHAGKGIGYKLNFDNVEVKSVREKNALVFGQQLCEQVVSQSNQ
jgi:hypothetical protein